MNWIINLLDRVPALAAIRKGLDGHKTYLVAVGAMIPIVTAWAHGDFGAGDAWTKLAPWIAVMSGRAALEKAS